MKKKTEKKPTVKRVSFTVRTSLSCRTVRSILRDCIIAVGQDRLYDDTDDGSPIRSVKVEDVGSR